MVALTGRGVSGHFRVSNKRNFQRGIESGQGRKTATFNVKISLPTITSTPIGTSRNPNTRKDSSQLTPDSVQLPAIPNAIMGAVTKAPRLSSTQREAQKRYNNELETPRSSLSKRRRVHQDDRRAMAAVARGRDASHGST